MKKGSGMRAERRTGAPKRAAQARPRRRYRDLVEAADVIIWEADPTGRRFTFVSRRAEALLGYPVRRWLSDPGFWLTIVDPDDRERAAALRKVIFAGRGGMLEYRARSAEGARLWLRETVRMAKGKGGQAAVSRGVIVDITELKQAEDVSLRLSSILDGKQNGLPKLVPLEIRRAERHVRSAVVSGARSAFLAEVGRSVPAIRDSAALADHMLRQLAPLFGLSFGLVTLFRPDGLGVVASWPVTDGPQHVDCDLPERMEKADALSSFPLAALRCPDLPRDITALVVLPVTDENDRRIGAMALGTRRPEGITDVERLELPWYANEVGKVLSLAISYEALAATATLDPLTGVLSRDAFYLRFAQEVSRATRAEQRLALVRWELSDLASLVGRDGERVAALAVRAFADVLRSQLRPYDVLGRIGAHEFAAVVFVKNHEVAHNIAARVQQHAVQTSFSRGKYLDVPWRGFALFPDDAHELETLDRVAEVRLLTHRDTRQALKGGAAKPQTVSETQAAG